MSQSESDNCNQVPELLGSHLATELHIYEPGDECHQAGASPTPSCETPTPVQDPEDRIPESHEVVLSTESPAAQKMGSHQLIPKTLASRPKNRHHTTVVTFPVKKSGGDSSESHSRHSAQVPDVPWEDYDSDGDGFDMRRNRRNRSYRAAVTSLDIEAMSSGRAPVSTLKPVSEVRASSPDPPRTLGRKFNTVRHSSSFHIFLGVYQRLEHLTGSAHLDFFCTFIFSLTAGKSGAASRQVDL